MKGTTFCLKSLVFHFLLLFSSFSLIFLQNRRHSLYIITFPFIPRYCSSCNSLFLCIYIDCLIRYFSYFFTRFPSYLFIRYSSYFSHILLKVLASETGLHKPSDVAFLYRNVHMCSKEQCTL